MDEEEKIAAERPFKLKEEANAAYSRGDYQEAIELWLNSIKETLKRSVRTPSADLWHNQVTCRLNLAMAYLKLEDYVEAKEQVSLVLEQKPTNAKALWRLAVAYEKMADWKACRTTLKKLNYEAERAEAVAAGKELPPPYDKLMHPEADSDFSSEDDSEGEELNPRKRLDLAGFTPREIRNLVGDALKRISELERRESEKRKKLLTGIGKRLDEIGAGEGREVPQEESAPESLQDHSTDADLDLTMEDLEDTCLEEFIKWKYRHPDSDSDTPVVEPTPEELKKRERLAQHATQILKDAVPDDVDDHRHETWTSPHTVETLQKNPVPLRMSLPLTFCYALEQLIKAPFKAALADSTDKANTEKPVFTMKLTKDFSPCGYVSRRIIRSIYRHRSLLVHVLGARGDAEMECTWTAVLKRIPKLRNLTMVFIGFNDGDDKWCKALKEGIVSPPLTKSQGLSGGKKLTCRLFKGLYQLFLSQHPDVLTNRRHPYYPDLVLIPEPRLAKYFDMWITPLTELIDHKIPTIVTAYSAVDRETHEAQNLPIIVKRLGGEWAMPLRPNVYAIKVKPEAECPPMELWAPSGETREKFSGISAKHAVWGCFYGKDGRKDYESIEELKNELRNVCDVDSEVTR